MNYEKDLKQQLVNMLKNISSDKMSDEMSIGYNLAITEVMQMISKTEDFLNRTKKIQSFL